jgi:hypothetical protein
MALLAARKRKAREYFPELQISLSVLRREWQEELIRA